MDENEPILNEPALGAGDNELKLNKEDQNNLIQTAKWAKFLGIVGFVMSGLIVLFGLSIMGGFLLGNEFGNIYGGMGSAMGFFYILFSLIYIFPSYYVFRFGTQISSGLRSGNQAQCSEAYSNLKKLFVFMGVMTVIVLSLYALAILFAVMGGLMGGML